MRQKHIIMLGGVKHCGKSTLGSLLAEKTGASFADTDLLIEDLYRDRYGEKAGCREIFRTSGEEAFRRLEAEAVAGFAAGISGRWVAALGGGAVANPFIQWHRLPVLRVMADVPEETVRKRILASGIPPFLGEDIRGFDAAFPAWFAERRKGCMDWAEMVFVPDPEASPDENAARLAVEIKEKRL